MVDLILYLLAVICFALAAVGLPKMRIHLGWLGLFFFALPLLIHKL